MNLLSLLIAPVQAVVLFFAPHAGTGKPSGLRMPVRANSSPHAQHVHAGHINRTHAGYTPMGHTHTTPVRAVYPRAKPQVGAKPIHRVRVVRNVDTSLPADRAGRMVVSGRFVDVCAELDKLASMEMQAA
jgi:hypothetical protein